MSDQDNTTHEEKVVKLLQSIVCLQSLALGLAFTQSKDIPIDYINNLESDVERILKRSYFK